MLLAFALDPLPLPSEAKSIQDGLGGDPGFPLGDLIVPAAVSCRRSRPMWAFLWAELVTQTR